MKARGDRTRAARCSFCGKRQDEVRKLVAGPGVYICDGCIRLCNEVLAEDAAPPGPDCGPGPKRPASRCRPAWLRHLRLASRRA